MKFNRIRYFKHKIVNFLAHPFRDLYHWLLVITWWQFLLLLSLFYFFVNVGFAVAYLTTNGGIANARPDSFIDAFFFSVQSLSTIGYGAMYPATLYAQILVTFEVLVGLLLVAMATGLMFARFAQPKARVLFSKVAVIASFNKIPTLMLRVANQRDNRIIEARIQMSLLKNEVSSEGMELRRFYNLRLMRSESPSFALSWLVMHQIDESSPFYGENIDVLIKSDAEVLVTLTGLDETFSQTIHARHIYKIRDILWSMRFVDILYKSRDGEYLIDYGRFHDVAPDLTC
ncbi:Inward rectifier potassium channel [Xenococcus sp. PCC 7305]|uniref:ion channel n=1 Tax=Xenococcus sp. PCC 7305 TaxID=102125 RepID=UPI0002ACF680|nr:ion channel [Xenococcus sp. PCC 7305]ELS04674.1 Inward rectifier potassium channel [Xenococcus sp. PCC 7305]